MQAVDSSYFRAMLDERLFSNERSLRFHHQQLFDGVNLADADVLDVGSGAGLNGFYAACSGANEVVCLEPEVDGSTAGAQSKFQRLRSNLGKTNIRIEPEKLQTYDPKGKQFDVILLHNSVNHLDEWACVNLKKDPVARQHYRDIFSKISAMAKPGAKLIVCDCTNYNFFGMLGLRNPFMPTIEWEKHQSPSVWASCLREVGFIKPRTRWSAFNRMGRLGTLLLGNKLAAWFLKSHFCLTMERKR